MKYKKVAWRAFDMKKGSEYMSDDEVAKLIKKIEIYLQSNSIQYNVYMQKRVLKMLKKIKKSAPESLQTGGTLDNKVLRKLYL